MPSTPPPDARRRRRRWFLLTVGVLLAILGIGLFAMPTLVRTEWLRAKILTRINQTLAPGRLNLDRFEVSWSGPTRLVGFELFAPDGSRVVHAPVAELNRTLGQLLLNRQAGSVLLLDQAALAIEQRRDGSLDLADALQSLIAHPDPDRDLTIRITRGSLSFRADNLADPIEAKTADLDLQIPPAPRAMTWKLNLGHKEGGTCTAQGEMNRWIAPDQDPSRASLELDLHAQRWPILVRTDAIDARFQLDGSIDLVRANQRWRSEGNLRLLEPSVAGKSLQGDILRPGQMALIWDGKQTETGWTIGRLTLDASLGSFRAEGSLDPTFGFDRTGATPPRIEGRVDLAAIARQLPHALKLRPGLSVEGGSARFVVESPASDPSTIHVEATIADLAARDQTSDRRLTLRDPATLSAEVNHVGGNFSIRECSARTAFATATVRGRLDDLSLTGLADLGACRRQLGDWIDLGPATGSGRADLSGSYRVVDHQYIARLAVQGHDLRLEGLPGTPIGQRSANFDLTVTGQPSPSSWPSSWDLALVAAGSSGTTGHLEFRPRGESIQVKARLLTKLPGEGPNQQVEAGLDGSWTGDRRLLVCDRITTRIVPLANVQEPNPLEFKARGEYDAQAGTIRIDPIEEPGSASSSIRVARSGVRVSGLDDLSRLRVDAGLEGVLPVLTGPPEQWSASITALGDPTGFRFSTKATTESSTSNRTGSIQIAGRYDRAADRVELLECEGRSSFGYLAATGRLDDLTGERRFELQGDLKPDFAAITAYLAREIEPGARINGRGRSFHLAGSLGGSDLPGRVEGEVGFDLAGADVYGMRLGPTPVLIRAGQGQIVLEPISTTLNEGHIRLESEIIPRDASGGIVLRLGKHSGIRDARINDEVSRRVLAFVAPVLEGATRARGRVSVDLDHAQIPLTLGRSKAIEVDGQVVFDDVVFAPGDLANDILGAIGRRDAVLRLDRPITLTIADGRINQSGLAIPIGGLTRIEVAGWVDFDKNLALTASLPVTPAMLGNNALLNDIVAGTMVRLPINGTLTNPTIDQDAFAANLKEVGKSLLTRGATRGALELLLQLGRQSAAKPNLPPAPPR